jgi:carboxyl-terminal processing protease
LDLRGNSGGGFRDVILIADLFLETGVVSSVKGRTPENSETVYASSGDVTRGMKLVVLIDANTAAGAEMIAAAIKDNQRGTIVGQRSAGLFGITSIVPLKHNHALRMTTVRWLRPHGSSGTGGITPDIVVAQTGEGDAQLAAALALARSN